MYRILLQFNKQHGGLFSRKDVSLDEINRINRFTEPGEEVGQLLMAQMLWSDPMEENGWKESIRPFGGAFGPDVTILLNPLISKIRHAQSYEI
ncbi:MAG: hypothetical protein EZS28_030099 [Streblomastix strix]|uniref:Uncharacterized protein n=1 Tax=Streblomastix strix TaxID=222440 RepID=A0A5J4UVQ9_9EUKA|nr:MAG: hypothetical protein EZS28_030099 [Streblomastix strix]